MAGIPVFHPRVRRWRWGGAQGLGTTWNQLRTLRKPRQASSGRLIEKLISVLPTVTAMERRAGHLS